MSSILKALKKLESEKSQRDELSTAVASDILRSSRHRRVKSLSLVVFGFVLAVVAAAVFGYFARVGVNESPQVLSSSGANGSAPIVPLSPAALPNQISDAPPPEISLPKAPQIKLPELSGIIYQEESANRLAIVNDLPVMEGTLVEGFTVKTILPQKVIVSRAGNEYELFLQQD